MIGASGEKPEAISGIGVPPVLVSIVVPCRNERGHIEACLKSILAQEPIEGGYEVIVADGMSDDGTREVLAELKRHDPRVRVADNELQVVPTGLNAAIRAARGEIVIRMDAHTEYAQDYVRQCVAVLRETKAENVGGPALTRGRGYVQRAICAAYHSPFSVGGARFHDPTYEGEADTVPYGCWRKETLLRVGLFDEELVRNQDDELNYRILLAGGTIWQSPRIRSWYHPRSSLTALWRQYRQYGYWKVRVIQKHNRPASLRHVIPVLFTLGVALGWLVGLVHPVFWLVYGGVLALYAAAALWSSWRAARQHGMDLLPLLPVVFLIYHLAYGVGFAQGIWDFLVLRGGPRRAMSTLSRTGTSKSRSPERALAEAPNDGR